MIRLKKGLVLFLLSFLVMACRETPNSFSNSENSIALLEQLKSLPQEFLIPSQKDTLIEGKKGTKIYVEANTFVDENGKPIVRDVELRIQEFITTQDIIHENISTVSPNGILETSGMLKIEAYSDGANLSLAEGKKWSFIFPSPPLKIRI